jgi:MSHA biogenesis protein MshL
MNISKWIILIITFAFLLPLINSCHIADPTHGGDTKQSYITKALKEDIRTNNKVNPQTQKQIPESISKALLPKMDISATTEDTSASQQRFDISVDNIPVRDFYAGLVKGTQYNVTVSPQLAGMVSLTLKNVTIAEVMDEMRNVYGYEYFLSGNTYEILPKRLETKVFQINFLDIKRSGSSQTSFGAGEITNTSATQFATATVTGQTTTQSANQSGSVQTSIDTDFWKSLQKNLELLVGTQEGRNVIVNPESGSIIVKAYPEELRNVARYLDSIQSNMERQVIIEAQVIEVALSAQYASGINWNVLSIHEGPGTNSNTTATTTINQIPSTFGDIFTFNPSAGGSFSAFIQLLNLQGRANILSNPRITATNNQKAVIKVGQDQFFVTNVSSNTVQGTTTNQSQNVELTPFFSGIALDVTPQIDDDDNLTLHIHPIVSKVVQNTQAFQVSGQDFSLPLALSTIRESDSIVHAHNEQIIIIGGLMENKSQDDTASTPGTEGWGWMKHLFGSSQKTATKYELVILLKPTIIKNNYNWNKNIKEALGAVNDMKNEFGYKIKKDAK